MLSGDLTVSVDNLASYIPLIQEGRMRAFANEPSVPCVPLARLAISALELAASFAAAGQKAQALAWYGKVLEAVSH